MRRQPNKSIFTVIFGICAGVLFVLCAGCSKPHPLTPPPDSDTVRVQQGVFVSGIDDVGQLKAVRSSVVATETGGKIAKLAPEGSFVKNGDPVFWLDMERLEQHVEKVTIQLRRTLSDYERAMEALAEEKFNLEQALKEKSANYAFDTLNVERVERELEQLQDRFARKLISETEVIATETQLEQLRLAKTASRISLERAELEYEYRRKSVELDSEIARHSYEQACELMAYYEKHLGYHTGYASADGIVVIRRQWNKEPFKVGDTVGLGTVVVEIPDMSEMMVWTQVSETHLARVFEGQPVWIRIPALENTVLEGVVESISWLAMPRSLSRGTVYSGADDDSSYGKVFEVAVRLTTQNERLRTGMNVSVVFVEERIPDVLTAPLSAIGQDKSGAHVFVYKNGRFNYRPVELGAQNRLEAVVTRGLEPGARIALFSLATKPVPEPGISDKGF